MTRADDHGHICGFVLCDDCGEPIASCWSKGRNKPYAYYFCDTLDCVSKRKSIPRAKIEDGEEAILRSLQPAKQLIKLVSARFVDVWEMRLAEARSAKATLNSQIKEMGGQTEALMDRLVEVTSPSVIQAYEARIEKLKRQEIGLAGQVAQIVPPKGRLDEFIKHALDFLVTH